MTDPPRLLDDSPGELESALLRAGREYHAPQQTHGRTLAALGILGSSALLAQSSAAATSLWSVKSLVIGGAVVGVVVATSAVVVNQRGPAPEAAPTASPPVAAIAAAEPTDSEDTSAEVEEEPKPVAERLEPNPEKEPTPSPATPRAASITAELKAIDTARSALAAGDGAGALRLLDDHARRFPQGRLHLEAEVLRIEALSRSGQGAAAKTRAKAFVERHPNSVFTPRVKRLAGE